MECHRIRLWFTGKASAPPRDFFAHLQELICKNSECNSMRCTSFTSFTNDPADSGLGQTAKIGRASTGSIFSSPKSAAAQN
jgi:hypothetical protein